MPTAVATEYSLLDAYALLEGLPSGTWAAISVNRNEIIASSMDFDRVVLAARSQEELDHEIPLFLCVLDRDRTLAV